MTTAVAKDPGASLEGEQLLRGDERITASRTERKYLVPYGTLRPLSEELQRRLPSHRFTGKGANALPDPHHYVTTVYFDTPTLRHFSAAREHPEDDVKVRAKAYYDLHPSLAEVATDPDELVHAPSVVWLEIKRRSGDHTRKARFSLAPGEVPAFFGRGGGGMPSGEGAQAELADGGPQAEALHYLRSLGEPLSALCVVNYRRIPFQDEEGVLRVTLDLGLSYYLPRDDVWTSRHALERSALGPAVSRESRAVLEVKVLGSTPDWLAELLSSLDLSAVRFSKFVAAAEAVRGRS